MYVLEEGKSPTCSILSLSDRYKANIKTTEHKLSPFRLDRGLPQKRTSRAAWRDGHYNSCILDDYKEYCRAV